MQKLGQALGFFFSYLLTHIDKALDIASGVLFWVKELARPGGRAGLGIDFYTSKRWLKKRENILRRDGYMCQRCKRYGRRVEATTVHHIEHYDERPDLALVDSNLISLCAACHNKQHPEKGGGRRYN